MILYTDSNVQTSVVLHDTHAKPVSAFVLELQAAKQKDLFGVVYNCESIAYFKENKVTT